MELELEIEELNFSYDEKLVLEDVGFELEKGEILSIIGPNGSGKSTFLKCINQILSPQEGRLFHRDRDLCCCDGEELAKRLGYVPQEEDRKFPAAVFDVILLGRKPYIDWKPSEEDYQITAEIIEKLQMGELAQRDVNTLSGGQLQKVIIGRALAQKAQILLMDEPTSSLDLKHQLEILNLIRAQADRGISVVLAIHDLSLAARFSDKFVMLKEGKVFASGGPEILSTNNIEAVYDVKVDIIDHLGKPLVIPRSVSAPALSG